MLFLNSDIMSTNEVTSFYKQRAKQHPIYENSTNDLYYDTETALEACAKEAPLMKLKNLTKPTDMCETFFYENF